MFADSLIKMCMGNVIVFCTLLLLVLTNTANVPGVYSCPRIQSKPLPLMSYEVVQIGKVNQLRRTGVRRGRINCSNCKIIRKTLAAP